MDDLSGITVVALEQAVAAPLASGKLAQAGARVIKIERPEGDFARGYDSLVKGQSAYFVWLNHGKESVCLDLKSPGDAETLRNLLRGADVFIQNLAPGAVQRLGFDPKTLRQENPSLITCSISGYGEDGPRAHQKAYDLLIQAETGLASITGTPDGPARVGVSVSDISAGMTAHAAILQALFARERSGEGRNIAISLFQATADWMNVPFLQHHYGGEAAGRHGLMHPTIAPYGVFACKDGKPILISIQNEREWAVLCDTTRCGISKTDPKFSSNSNRVANRDALDAALKEAFKTKMRSDWADILQGAGIAFGRLSSLADLADHPQSTFMTIQSGSGPIRILAPAAGNAIPGAVPELGADTARIKAEFSE